jgi:hypothetical protein
MINNTVHIFQTSLVQPLSGRADGPHVGVPPGGGRAADSTSLRRFNRCSQQDYVLAILRRCVALRLSANTKHELAHRDSCNGFWNFHSSGKSYLTRAAKTSYSVFSDFRRAPKLRQAGAKGGLLAREFSRKARDFWILERCFSSVQKSICSKRRVFSGTSVLLAEFRRAPRFKSHPGRVIRAARFSKCSNDVAANCPLPHDHGSEFSTPHQWFCERAKLGRLPRARREKHSRIVEENMRRARKTQFHIHTRRKLFCARAW